MKKLIYISLFFFSLVLFSCTKNEINCTMEFRSVGITITGDSLTKFYTIRNSNHDTIRNSSGIGIFGNIYPVLDDNYQHKLVNTQDYFTFYGFVNDSLKVKEVFEIKADYCHVEKISGKDEVHISHK
ncbi:MAG: hypothetical protein NTZ33_09775 [Bacteroidetes bacterium]|nr:hypothetical protein [Bacteroidota bacterium]